MGLLRNGSKKGGKKTGIIVGTVAVLALAGLGSSVGKTGSTSNAASSTAAVSSSVVAVANGQSQSLEVTRQSEAATLGVSASQAKPSQQVSKANQAQTSQQGTNSNQAAAQQNTTANQVATGNNNTSGQTKTNNNGGNNAGGGDFTPNQPLTNVTGQYIINKNSDKFHLASCSTLKTMSAENKEIINGSREEIIARGFVPCKKCNP